MAYLSIKGHPTRGKEVIDLLETLGANRLGYKDTFVGFYYYVECGAICSSNEYPTYATIFTLEEFLEKYPYKVGDEVEYKSIGDANLKSKIIYMDWCNSLNEVLYTTEDAHVISTEDITETKSFPPYMDYDIKEEIMEKNQPPKTQEEVDKYLQKHPIKNAMNVMDIESCLETDGLKLSENVVINSKGIGSIQFIQWYEKQQHPKTYEECCEVLGISLYDVEIDLPQPYQQKMFNLFKLHICRDAYRKIAGEQMGLGKPWEPDYTNPDIDLYVIINVHHNIEKAKYGYGFQNCVLSFPTPEMRDAFYEYFKELIEECKELL